MRSSRNGEYCVYEEPPKKRRGGIAFIVVLIIAAAAVAIIGVSKVGGFVSDKIVAPVAAWFNPDEDTEIETADTQQTGSFELSAGTLYALQVGVFSSEENANVFANELRARGGAGYVMEDAGSWRVLIAGYADRADAESVKQRLKSEQQMESKLLEISAEANAFTVTADAASLEAVKTGAEMSNIIVARICDMSIRVDKGELSADSAAEEISALAEEIDSITDGLDAIDEAGGAAEVMSVYLKRVKTALADIQTGSLTEISGGLKRAYIEAALGRKDISDTLDGKTLG